VSPRGDALRFLDPKVVGELKSLDLVARLVVEGFLTGLHKSPYHGFSVEFAEHRQYMPGDPIRHVDWKIYAKSDRFYVKMYEEETNLRGYLLMDTSASMGYASPGNLTKLRYGSYLAAALAYLMINQQDSVGLLTFGESVNRFIPPRAVKNHLKIIYTELEALKPTAGTNTLKSLQDLADRIHRRGLIVLISDLMDDPRGVLTSLKHFRHKKHEVIVFHVLDPFERDFPFKDESGFVDMETGREVLTQPWEIAKDYRRKFGEWQAEYARLCRENMIDYIAVDTSVPFDRSLLAYLEKRKRLG
jgi:uncharacterized protein (DUF58 family)